jgi:DNA-binding beta-propeller fold protein YncE
MNAGQARTLLAQAGAALVASALIAGCGNNYRPVVTPINPSGPAAQPTSYVVVVSTTSPTTPGVATIIDYSGDTVMAEAPIGPGPITFTIDELGANAYTLNSDGTISNFSVSTSLQAKYIYVSTLPPTAEPVNLMAPAQGLWASDLSGNVADLFTGAPEDFKLAVPVGNGGVAVTMPMFITGSPTLNGQREYAVSQDVPDTSPMACNDSPKTVGVNGVVTPIEIANNSADAPIGLDYFNQDNTPAGTLNAQCPVFAIQSPDLRRLFVLNRGSDTISVINSQNNGLDECVCPPTGCLNQNAQAYFCHPMLPLSLTAVSALNAASTTAIPPAGGPPNGTVGMSAIAGPVDGEYNQATQQLVVANYDGGSISVIDVSLDEYGNDSPTFGTTYTIPVGNTPTPNPASVTVLYDGSKAYTANQNDGTSNGTVTVVNLSTHTVEKTLTVVGHPRTVVSTQNSEYSKIYAASPDSPYLTIIESTPTETDQVDTTVLVEGNVVDVRVTTENGSSGANSNYSSRVPGYGQPCNLPGASQTVSLAACMSIQ